QTTYAEYAQQRPAQWQQAGVAGGIAVADRPTSPQPLQAPPAFTVPAPAPAAPQGEQTIVRQVPRAPQAPVPPPAPAPVPVAPATNGYQRGVLMVRSGPSAGLRYQINAPRIIVGRRST